MERLLGELEIHKQLSKHYKEEGDFVRSRFWGMQAEEKKQEISYRIRRK